jgi:hypothetical protein
MIEEFGTNINECIGQYKFPSIEKESDKFLVNDFFRNDKYDYMRIWYENDMCISRIYRQANEVK